MSHFVNRDSNVLRVEFRCMGDELDEVRTDVIEYTYVEEFGYDSGVDYDEFFDEYEEDEWDYDDDDEEFMDEETLLAFLNEYYVVYPKLPDAEQL